VPCYGEIVDEIRNGTSHYDTPARRGACPTRKFARFSHRYCSMIWRQERGCLSSPIKCAPNHCEGNTQEHVSRFTRLGIKRFEKELT